MSSQTFYLFCLNFVLLAVILLLVVLHAKERNHVNRLQSQIARMKASLKATADSSDIPLDAKLTFLAKIWLLETDDENDGS